MKEKVKILLGIVREKAPMIKKIWIDYTDAGPGVGVSNKAVRFREAELARLQSSDYRYSMTSVIVNIVAV